MEKKKIHPLVNEKQFLYGEGEVNLYLGAQNTVLKSIK
jgi:hypothetical protein